MPTILWDLDGPLVPSEPLRDKAHQETVKHFGGTISPGFYLEIDGTGRPHEDVRKEFIRESGIETDEQHYSDVFYKLLFAALFPTPGIHSLINLLNAKGYRQAVVTGNYLEQAEKILAITNLRSGFERIVAKEHFRKPKPAPDSYQFALRSMGVEPENAIAIEDSTTGLTAAREAGLRVIAFRHNYNTDHDFTKAIAMVESFADPSIHEIINSAF